MNLTSTLSQTGWIILGTALGFMVFAGLFLICLTAFIIFRKTLYRSPKKPRKREYSVHKFHASTEEKMAAPRKMFDEGTLWAEQFSDITDDLHIVNDNLNLYGQYINFGFDKCAVIIQGRTESLLYSYYFAEVYAKNDYNILVIDTRAHGLSDGKFVTAGVLEYRDVIKWIELVKDKYFINSFVIHGICIGAANAIYAYSEMKAKNDENSRLIKKVVLDGTYSSYFEIFSRHHKERKKPVFPFVQLIFFYLYLATGARLLKKIPLKEIANLDIPTLFIYSKEDIYCTPEKNKQLFDACSSHDKEIRIFPKGRHSHVRINQPEDYDQTIDEFLKKYQE